MTRIRPLRDRMVVEPLDEPMSSILAVVCDRNHYRGRVLAVGPKVAWGTKVGDIVQFTDIMRFPVIMDRGEKRLILQEADVLFIEEVAHAA